MRLKKVMALVLTGALVVTALTGCKSSTSDTGAQPDTSSDGVVTKDNITITMMYSGTVAENDFETEVLPKLVHEAFPNITLEVTKLPDDQYYTSLKTKLASGECPDIILVQPKYAGANSVIGLAKAGYLEPVTDLKVMDKIGKAGTESFTYNNEIYAVPSGVTILGTYYNKDMFDANGLSCTNELGRIFKRM